MKKYIQWLGRAVRPYRGPMAVMMGCHVLLAACSVFFVYICKKLVDIAIAVFNGADSENGLWQWLGMMVGVILFRILLNSLRTYLQTKTEIRLKNSLQPR